MPSRTTPSAARVCETDFSADVLAKVHKSSLSPISRSGAAALVPAPAYRK
jgi:hypothetical protein